MRNHSSGGRDRGRDRNLIPVRRNFRRQHASSPSHHFQSSFLISLDILWIFFFFFLSQPAFLPFLSPSILAPFSPMHSLSLSRSSSTPQPHSSLFLSLLPYRWTWMQNTVCSEHLGPSAVWQCCSLREQCISTRLRSRCLNTTPHSRRL